MKNKKIILVMMVILAFGLMISCSKDVKTDLTPGEHVTKAYENLYKDGAIDISAIMSLDLDYAKLQENYPEEEVPEEVVTLLNNLTFNMDYKIKVDKEKYDFDYALKYGINYEENPLLDIIMILNNDKIGFGFTNLYDKLFTVNFADLIKLASESEDLELWNMDFKKYIAILLSNDSETYKKVSENESYRQILNDFLNNSLSEGVNEEITYDKNGETITENVMTYELNIDMQKYFEMIFALVAEAKTDEDMKAYVNEIGNKLIDELISSKDYELLGMTEEDVQMMKESFETEIIGNWTENLTQFEEEYSNMEELYTSEEYKEIADLYSNFTMKISINKDEEISQMSSSADTDGIKYDMLMTINATGDDVVIDSYDEKTVNLMDFINLDDPTDIQNKEELAKITKEFMVSAIDELVNGEGYKALFEDLEPLEDELGFKVSDINMYLGMAKAYVDNISEEDILLYLDSVSSMLAPYDYDYDYDTDTDYTYDDIEYPELDHIALFVDNDLEEQYIDEYSWYMIQDLATDEIAVSRTVTDEMNAMSEFETVINEGADLIFVIGKDLSDTIVELVYTYPDVYFVPLDSYPDAYTTNLTYVDYYNEEVAYLAGYYSALSTESNSIGYIGASNEIYNRNFGVNFSKGAFASQDDLTVIQRYLEDETDPVEASDLVKELKAENVDYIYVVSGLASHEVVDACQTYGIKVITHNDLYGFDNESFVGMTGTDYQGIIYDIVYNFMNGVHSDYYAYGVADDYMFIDYSDSESDEALATDIIRSQIDSGELFIETYYGE